MRYLSLFLIGIFVYLNAQDFNINKKAVEELRNYSLPAIKEIYNPFIVVVQKKKEDKKKNDKLKKQIQANENRDNLVLLAVLNGKVLLKIIDLKETKWFSMGEKVDGYKLVKIINNNSLLISKNKKNKVITMKSNNLNIKVR